MKRWHNCKNSMAKHVALSEIIGRMNLLRWHSHSVNIGNPGMSWCQTWFATSEHNVHFTDFIFGLPMECERVCQWILNCFCGLPTFSNWESVPMVSYLVYQWILKIINRWHNHFSYCQRFWHPLARRLWFSWCGIRTPLRRGLHQWNPQKTNRMGFARMLGQL